MQLVTRGGIHLRWGHSPGGLERGYVRARNWVLLRVFLLEAPRRCVAAAAVRFRVVSAPGLLARAITAAAAVAVAGGVVAITEAILPRQWSTEAILSPTVAATTAWRGPTAKSLTDHRTRSSSPKTAILVTASGSTGGMFSIKPSPSTLLQPLKTTFARYIPEAQLPHLQMGTCDSYSSNYRWRRWPQSAPEPDKKSWMTFERLTQLLFTTNN